MDTENNRKKHTCSEMSKPRKTRRRIPKLSEDWRSVPYSAVRTLDSSPRPPGLSASGVRVTAPGGCRTALLKQKLNY